MASFQEPSQLDDQLNKAEASIREALTKDGAYKATLDAVELHLHALKLTKDGKRKKSLDHRCRALLQQAEGMRAVDSFAKAPASVINQANSNGVEELKQPRSTRVLSKREEIILLQGGKLNGGVFPQWVGEPSLEEFDSRDGLDLFTDPTEFGFSDQQSEVFDGWRRPTDLFTTLNALQFPPDSKRIEATMVPEGRIDLVQDITSDCSVVASLCASVARASRGHVKILPTVMYPYDHANKRPTISPNGKYVFKFQFNGCFRKVVVDDRLPTSNSERALYVVDRNNPGLLWPGLLEKAYLKVRGGYDFLGSNSGTDILILGGWIPEQLFLQRYNLMNANAARSTSYSFSDTLGLSDDIVPSAFWRRIFNSFSYGDVVLTMGTGKLTYEEEHHLGLASEHDYAVLDMKEEGGRRTFLIKNPWSRGSIWRRPNTQDKGSLESPHDPIMNTETKLLSPGTFWMDLHDVLQYFETIYLNWNPGLFSCRQDIHFTWDLRINRSSTGSFLHNPQYVLRCQEGGTVWLLLSRHFQDAAQTPNPKSKDCDAGFMSLYAFDYNGHRVTLSDRSLVRSPYVDTPNSLLRLELPAKSVYTIVVSEQDLPDRSFNFSIAAFSLSTLSIAPALEKYPHATSLTNSWTLSTAGGNANHHTYFTNPQFCLSLPALTSLSLLLIPTNHALPTHLKLLWARGARATSITTRDILGDSGEYRRGAAFCELPSVPAGSYTLIVSTFSPDQLSDFVLTVRSSACACILTPLPAEEAGRLIIKPSAAVFARGIDRLLAPLVAEQITRLRAHAVGKGQHSAGVSPLRVRLEWGQGPNKRVLASSGGDEFLGGETKVRTEECDVRPEMCSEWGVWVVVERVGGVGVREWEAVEVEILSDVRVEVGAWGMDVD